MTSARFARGRGAGLGLARGAFLGFLEAVTLPFQGDDLGPMHEAVDEGDDAGGVGEDLCPFSKHFIGRKQDRPV